MVDCKRAKAPIIKSPNPLGCLDTALGNADPSIRYLRPREGYGLFHLKCSEISMATQVRPGNRKPMQLSQRRDGPRGVRPGRPKAKSESSERLAGSRQRAIKRTASAPSQRDSSTCQGSIMKSFLSRGSPVASPMVARSSLQPQKKRVSVSTESAFAPPRS